MKEDSELWQVHARSILKAQVYIQNNLDEQLTLEKIAKVACFSPYHFHRIFRAATGESLNSYIRRLRVEKAGGRLKHTEESVTEIALDSGYQTPASFSRAFQQVMGTSPSNYRSGSADPRDGIPKTQKRTEKTKMKPEIIEMSEQPVLFVRRVGPYSTTPSAAWDTLLDFARDHHPLLENARRFSDGLDDPNVTDEENLRFDACISAPKEAIEKGDVGRRTLEGGKYAVFMHKGPYDKLEETFDAIFQDWYPLHKDEVAERSCFCEHLNMDMAESHPEKLLSKIYVPLK